MPASAAWAASAGPAGPAASIFTCPAAGVGEETAASPAAGLAWSAVCGTKPGRSAANSAPAAAAGDTGDQAGVVEGEGGAMAPTSAPTVAG